jgi:peptidoglycan/xylan/chitin deacetylase (PgdA/CDA1 family)
VAAGRPLPVNTLGDLRRLAEVGVEIGAHTRGHTDIGAISSREQLLDEIAGCKQELEQSLGCDVRYFAFPYGQQANLSAAAFHIAREAGYVGVCSAYGGYNFPGDDAFHLRRIHADPEFIRFKNWLTVDPRKVRAQRSFDPRSSGCLPLRLSSCPDSSSATQR